MTTRTLNKAKVDLWQLRIDACDTLLDYIHDDLAWKDQEPLKGILTTLRNDLNDELMEGTTDDQ